MYTYIHIYKVSPRGHYWMGSKVKITIKIKKKKQPKSIPWIIFETISVWLGWVEGLNQGWGILLKNQGGTGTTKLPLCQGMRWWVEF